MFEFMILAAEQARDSGVAGALIRSGVLLCAFIAAIWGLGRKQKADNLRTTQQMELLKRLADTVERIEQHLRKDSN